MRLPLSVASALLISFANPAGAFTINFDNLTSGTPITTLEGVTFSSNIVGFDLVVSSQFDTTSPANYLGVDDGGFEVFFPGDVITLVFSAPIRSLNVNFVSSPNTPGGAFSIVTAVGSSTSDATPNLVLGDGGEVFPVSFTSATPFSTADLSSGSGLFSYNVDDIDVPEPSVALLLASGFAGLARRARKYLAA